MGSDPQGHLQHQHDLITEPYRKRIAELERRLFLVEQSYSDLASIARDVTERLQRISRGIQQAREPEKWAPVSDFKRIDQ